MLILFAAGFSVDGFSADDLVGTPISSVADTDWKSYGGSSDSMQYSPLSQINKGNVRQLKQVWFYPAPVADGRIAFNPLVIDGVMYVCAEGGALVALNAVTGVKLWSYPMGKLLPSRGVSYWKNTKGTDQRILFAADNFLQAVDAKSGLPVKSFGVGGKVDLRDGMPRVHDIQSATPGRVFENLIIVGSVTGDDYNSAPGDIRAYDTVTGALVWTFHTIPRPGEYGYDTWPVDAWKQNGGANAWGEMSLDVQRGIVYIPTAAPTYDFYGQNRKGANLFANCLLALDARTGKRLWHFQTVHHDLWDYDLATAPKLLTVNHNNKNVDVVVQATKSGFLFVFDRVSGAPLWPIEERPVPASHVPGEAAWPTQPFPTWPPAFARQSFGVADLSPYMNQDEKKRLQEIVLHARNEGIFTPPDNTVDQISMPGEGGGTNWGGVAVDPESSMLYVRTMDNPMIHHLRFRGEKTPENLLSAPRGYAQYHQHCEKCHGEERSRIEYPNKHSADEVLRIVRNGTAEMPAIPEDVLSQNNFNDLLTYLAGEPFNLSATSSEKQLPLLPVKEGKFRKLFGQPGNSMKTLDGMPVITPPWSELVAYDMDDGGMQWRVPLGTVPALAEKGITNTGSSVPSRSGLVVTAGGLIFIGTAADRTVRAYDKNTGAVLWEARLPANPEGIPAVYAKNNKQYIVFFCSTGRADIEAAWSKGKPEAQGYYVFALPDD
ncbi:MAG TPA: PQQ-binding-like beta-propeller repeat protein [Pseudomonadales bacterium]|nr:PQQ-binding-like beta-propeller repeat protein [Pseudomonadales bacterium]